MRNLEKKEWIAVAVSLFVVAFFFVFGNELIFLFTNNNQENSVLNNRQATLQIQDTAMGTGDEAMKGSKITVHYTGMFTDGTVFDSSVSRNEPFQFVLGMGQVIAGLDQGLVGMRVGGKRILVIPPDMGYGNSDNGPIPGGSTLIFEVELLKVEI